MQARIDTGIIIVPNLMDKSSLAKRIALRAGQIGLIIACAATGCGDSPVTDSPQPSAREILDQSMKAMGPPIQYRMRTGTVDVVVSQKTMGNGSIALRTETAHPFHRISLTTDKGESFEWYPKIGLVIDRQALQKGAMKQAEEIAASLKNKVTSSTLLTKTLTRNGKKCFEVHETLSPEVVAAVEKSAPSGGVLPGSTRYIIEADTYNMLEQETLTSTGASISKIEYYDIVRKPDLPNSLFLPPDGLDIKKPATIHEYVQFMAQAFEKQPTQPVTPPIVKVAPPIYDTPLPRLKATIDPATGRLKAPAPSGMSQEQFDLIIAAKSPEDKLEQKPRDTSRRIGALLTITLILGAIIYYTLRRRGQGSKPNSVG